jgi:hypothetical protein
MFFQMYVSRVFGLLIKTVQPPVLTDELACDSSIACIKDLYCVPRNVLNCVLEKLPMCARLNLSFALVRLLHSCALIFVLVIVSRTFANRTGICPLDARALL